MNIKWIRHNVDLELLDIVRSLDEDDMLILETDSFKAELKCESREDKNEG